MIVIGIVDFNIPGATVQKNLEALVDGMTILNDSNPIKNMCIAYLPENPKASSLRGLYDEDKAITDALFANEQWSDAKFIELFKRPRKSGSKSNSRLVGEGRIVVNHAARSENIWMQSSELATKGRPMGSNSSLDDSSPPAASLPKASEMFQPVNTNANEDLHLAEKFSPGEEQRAAQKGISRHQIILESAFTNMEINAPTLAVCLTGYVEDPALAASI